MSTKAITTRYAHALLLEAASRSVEKTVEADLEIVQSMLKASADLRILFRSPIIEPWRKKRIVKELFESKVHELTLTFLLLVFEKGREKFMDDIIQSFYDQLDVKRNVLRVDVVSANTLDEGLRTRLTSALGQKTGKNVIPSFDVEPTLIGGVTITIGDAVIDGSLRQRLTLLKEQLANN